jgi:two-component system nitrate/nitrite response regulator NarL
VRCVSVVIADRQPVVLCGLTTLLRAQKGFNVVASCSDGTKCMQAIRALSPDIAVLDISLPGLAGPEILAAATSESLRTRVIFLTASVEDRRYAGCQEAYSVISKEAAPEIFVYCLRQVAAGRRLFPIEPLDGIPGASKDSSTRTVLTERECQIMELVSKGLSNKEIGRRLSLSEGTIKVHLHHTYQKLGIKNRTILATVRHQRAAH